MAEASVPADLFNPGQVFACLGFLEAANVLLGDAEGGFDWHDDSHSRFLLRAAGERNPFEAVLEYMAEAKVIRYGPIGYSDPPPKKGKAVTNEEEGNAFDAEEDDVPEKQGPTASPELSEIFPAPAGERSTLPIRLHVEKSFVMTLSHWTDATGRNDFKLYSGNRSADGIARAMLLGVRNKATKKQTIESVKTKGVAQLWQEQRDAMIQRPFDVLTPMGGSFNFDPRGAWTAIDAGYSPNDQKHRVAASPVVEILAALGLENARPEEYQTRKVRYSVWGMPLAPILARAALFGGITSLPQRHFHFELAMSGKNKVVTFADEETPT